MTQGENTCDGCYYLMIATVTGRRYCDDTGRGVYKVRPDWCPVDKKVAEAERKLRMARKEEKSGPVKSRSVKTNHIEFYYTDAKDKRQGDVQCAVEIRGGGGPSFELLVLEEAHTYDDVVFTLDAEQAVDLFRYLEAELKLRSLV